MLRVGAAAAALVLAACSGTPAGSGPSGAGQGSAQASLTAASAPASGSSATVEASAVTAPAALAASFAQLQKGLSGPAGIAVVGVGGSQVVRLGSLDGGAAWSTSKVPLAVAALQRSGSARTRSDVRAAITRSDNDAAARLWSGLGSGTRAAGAVQAVLRSNGDLATRVQYRQVRPPYSSFGQTQWTLVNSAVVAAHLPCVRADATTWQLMGQVASDQRWGLGRVKGARFKGGWGPEGSGYLVRQLGVVPGSTGSLGVAIIVRSPRGFTAGTRDLDRITSWLQQHRAQLPHGGPC